MALSAFLPFWFVASGLVKVGHGGSLHRIVTWPFLLISGIISIVFAIVMWAAYPALDERVIGILFGSDFIATAIALSLIACMSNFGYKLMTSIEENEEVSYD